MQFNFIFTLFISLLSNPSQSLFWWINFNHLPSICPLSIIFLITRSTLCDHEHRPISSIPLYTSLLVNGLIFYLSIYVINMLLFVWVFLIWFVSMRILVISWAILSSTTNNHNVTLIPLTPFTPTASNFNHNNKKLQSP